MRVCCARAKGWTALVTRLSAVVAIPLRMLAQRAALDREFRRLSSLVTVGLLIAGPLSGAKRVEAGTSARTSRTATIYTGRSTFLT